LARVLAEQRRCGGLAERRFEPERRRDEVERADLRMLDRSEAAGGSQRLVDAADLSGRDARLVEGGDPLVGRARGEGFLEQRDELLAVADARGVRGEALVGRELGAADGSTQPRIEALVRGGNRDPAVGGPERLVRDDARVRVAVSRGLLAG